MDYGTKTQMLEPGDNAGGAERVGAAVHPMLETSDQRHDAARAAGAAAGLVAGVLR